MEPLLKWAGGKRQLLPEIKKIITPEILEGHTLYEPFVGGGAVFLSYEHMPVVINDSNNELINVYEVIRDHPIELISLLAEHAERHSHDYYYYIQKQDENEEYSILTTTERAARFIYLNRTCFNGLYRVNSKGHFNVPLGRYMNPSILDKERIEAISAFLNQKNVSIRCGDFTDSVYDVKSGDIVYFDPPYDYEFDTNGFKSYTPEGFSRADLKRLKVLCDFLISKGCFVVVSNNDTEYVKELFAEKQYYIQPILAKRMINSNGKKRNNVREVLIYGSDR